MIIVTAEEQEGGHEGHGNFPVAVGDTEEEVERGKSPERSEWNKNVK